MLSWGHNGFGHLCLPGRPVVRPFRRLYSSIKVITSFYVTPLSSIADAHTYHADKSELGVFDPKCLKLAEAHNIAVDAPKTGKVVPPMEELSVSSWPDFMNVNKGTIYLSKKILGILYRLSSAESAKLAAIVPTPEEWASSYDKELELPGYEKYVDVAIAVRDLYFSQLNTSMQLFKIHDETSAVLGETLYTFRSERRAWESKKEGYEFASKDLRNRFRDMFGLVSESENSSKQASSDSSNNSESSSSDLATSSSPYSTETTAAISPSTPTSSFTHEQLLKASAWYVVTYNKAYRRKDGLTMWSFPWLIDDVLCHIKKTAVLKRRQEAKLNIESPQPIVETVIPPTTLPDQPESSISVVEPIDEVLPEPLLPVPPASLPVVSVAAAE